MNPDRSTFERLRAYASELDQATPAVSTGEVRARAAAGAPSRRGWRHARVVVVAAVAAVIVGVGALVVPIVLRSDQDGTPSVVGGPTTTKSPPGAAVADRFVPPTFRDGPEQVMPLTLLDGRRLELRYPPDLDLAEFGVLPIGAIDWPVRSDPFRCCGSVLRVRYTTIDAIYGDAEPITTYPGADGRPVRYYHGSDAGRTTPFDYLVFEFGPWLVEVPDIQEPGDFEDRKTEEERATWARSLRGNIDPNGYLVLDPAPPLTLQLGGELAVIGGPAAPGGSALGLPHVELFTTEAVCAPDSTKETTLERFDFESGDDVGAGWCDAEAGVRISVSGPQDFVDRAISGLEAESGPAGVPTRSNGLRIDPPLPEGWIEVPGPLYIDIDDPGPPAEATVATFDVPGEPSRVCDYPVAALERLGPDDAFISVVEARVSGDTSPRPPATSFLPLDVPLDLVPESELDLEWEQCLARQPDFRFNETGFAENGRLVRVLVALGLDASPTTEAEVVELINRIVVEPRT